MFYLALAKASISSPSLFPNDNFVIVSDSTIVEIRGWMLQASSYLLCDYGCKRNERKESRLNSGKWARIAESIHCDVRKAIFHEPASKETKLHFYGAHAKLRNSSIKRITNQTIWKCKIMMIGNNNIECVRTIRCREICYAWNDARIQKKYPINSLQNSLLIVYKEIVLGTPNTQSIADIIRCDFPYEIIFAAVFYGIQ